MTPHLIRTNWLSLLAIVYTGLSFGQDSFRALVKDGQTKEALPGASAIIQGTTRGSSADETGLLVIPDIPAGKQTITFSYIGYIDRTITYTFPLSQAGPAEIFLSVAEGEELDEVILTSTRSSRTISNIPTRIEAISGEELEEKGNMKPGDIRMMLNESTGIQTQQTSATSYNSGIRIQGLDGKYTQILRDGFPLYSGFSGGLSLMQIAPLDLEQVEVVKGASSTLYGGGAIAGLVNLISKKPREEREISLLLNGTSALGLDASIFYAQKFRRIGTTIFASYNVGTPYDPSDTGFTAIPEFSRFTVNPKLFVYFDENTTGFVGFNTTIEERTGGDIRYIKYGPDPEHTYFEKNNTNRLSTQLGLDHFFGQHAKLSFKNSISIYDRSIEIPGYRFSGDQLSSFSEATFGHKRDRSEWITGLNLWTDRFGQNSADDSAAVDYNYTTVGAFIQNTWNATEKLVLETGLRTDYQNEYGIFALPRVSALLKASPKLALRLGGGLGYKTPTVFTEDAERIQFRSVLPIDVSRTAAERSVGGNFDINYRTPLSDAMTFSFNTLLFYTQVQDPLILTPVASNAFEFLQPNGYIDTRGIETNIKLTYKDLKLFVGHTLANVKEHYNGNTTTFPLVAKHRLNNVLMYEIEESLKMGLEAYYFSPQELNDDATGRSYWLFGFMVEKIWEQFSVFINFENFGNTRQTRFDTIYTGTLTDPTFRDIYAPVDGFVVNGGLKIKL